MFYEPTESAEFMQSAQMKETVTQVMTYVYTEGIFNEVFGGTVAAKGVKFPDGVVGDPANVRLTIDPSFVL